MKKYESIIRSYEYWSNADIVCVEYIAELYKKLKRSNERIYDTVVLLEDLIIGVQRLKSEIVAI